jgi:mannosyl-glycoprotein endo-beta-N-acetylglucosaminidase
VETTVYYGFDGWLLNFESQFPLGTDMTAVSEFIRYLTEICHARIPGSEVVFYDSLTVKNKIHWQNCLNSENQLFFNKAYTAVDIYNSFGALVMTQANVFE